jgi:hypothetical protein
MMEQNDFMATLVSLHHLIADFHHVRTPLAYFDPWPVPAGGSGVDRGGRSRLGRVFIL